jgi:hypothetical protein
VEPGLDRDSIAMREVSPMGGLMSQEERQRVFVALPTTARIDVTERERPAPVRHQPAMK